LVDGIGCIVVTIVFQRLVDLGRSRVQFGHDPAGFERCVLGNHRHCAQRGGINGDADLCSAVHVHEEETRGVPNLIGEGAIALGAAMLKAMSVPGEAIEASVKRTASVP